VQVDRLRRNADAAASQLRRLQGRLAFGAGAGGEPVTAARYRRPLWAYPGHYRRRHGDEIVTTMLDQAEAGHGR